MKLGQDLENRAAHPYHEFPGIPPTPTPPPPNLGCDIKLALLSPGLVHRRKGFQEWVRWGGGGGGAKKSTVEFSVGVLFIG